MTQTESLPTRVAEIARLFFRLGCVAFGGPAAHIAMMHDEVVEKRQWLDDQEFLDLLGATNLIPGPNSTEMAIHICFVRAGWLGLLIGGVCFIGPAVVLVLLCAWLYVQYGATPQAAWLLYGVQPVVMAVIAQALWKLGKKAAKGWLTLAVGTAVFFLYFLGFNEIFLLFAGGLLVMLVANAQRLRHAAPLVLPATLTEANWYIAFANAPIPFNLGTMFLAFLKIGSVLYGSGYVLLAFLRTDFVERFGWLTDQQLLDAIAIGQLTPGPVFTTATFIGYLLGGLTGGLLATLAIFLPPFLFVGLSSPLIPRIRNSVWVSRLLDGVNVAALGLMAAVTLLLAQNAITDWLTLALAVGAFVLLFRFNVNAAWLVIGGAAVGGIVAFLQ